jgi:hypothetical protein
VNAPIIAITGLALVLMLACLDRELGRIHHDLAMANCIAMAEHAITCPEAKQ